MTVRRTTLTTGVQTEIATIVPDLNDEEWSMVVNFQLVEIKLCKYIFIIILIQHYIISPTERFTTPSYNSHVNRIELLLHSSTRPGVRLASVRPAASPSYNQARYIVPSSQSGL